MNYTLQTTPIGDLLPILTFHFWLRRVCSRSAEKASFLCTHLFADFTFHFSFFTFHSLSSAYRRVNEHIVK